ncbi:MAG: aspartyl protease family protein [Pseudobdellovibrio sp.]
MEKLILFLFIIYHSTSFAGGFTFIPKKALFESEIELINAKVQLSHNGLEYSCLVDTGARFTIFKEAILKDLPKVGETIGGGISNSSQITDLVNLNLQLGDWKKINATVGRTNRIPFDCIIGNDFFINKKFQINFNKNEISDLNDDINLETSFPLRIYRSDSGGHFGFAMNLAEKTVETIFDTGASGTVVSLAFVKENAEHFKLIKELDVTDGNNADLKAGLYELDQISFGNDNLKKVKIYALDLSNLKSKLPNVEIVLGLNIIQNFNWQLDTQNSYYFYNLKN